MTESDLNNEPNNALLIHPHKLVRQDVFICIHHPEGLLNIITGELIILGNDILSSEDHHPNSEQ